MQYFKGSHATLRDVREDFPIFREYPRLVYLDNAATTHKPEVVLDTLIRFYKSENSNVHRAVHRLAERATHLYETARHTIASFINSRPEEVVFTRGTTESLNLLAYSLSLIENYSAFIVPEFEHHSNFVPWQQLASRFGKEFVPLEIRGFEIDMESFERIIHGQKRPFVFAASGLTNSTGYRLPIDQVIRTVHKNGGVVVIDGAQLIPHEPFDFKQSGVDFLAFSAHKMVGPTGAGALVGKKELLEKLPPFNFGGEMIDRVELHDTTFAPVPQKFEAGTPNIAGTIAFAEAAEYLLSLDKANVSQHIRMLTSYCHELLSGIEGLRVLSPQDSHGIVSFTHERVHPHDVAEFLSRNLDVAVRSGHHCAQLQMRRLGVKSTCRASFYVYNTVEDVESLAAGIKQALRWFG